MYTSFAKQPITIDPILPFPNTSAPAQLRLPVPHVSTKPLKSSLSLHTKIFYIWNKRIKKRGKWGQGCGSWSAPFNEIAYYPYKKSKVPVLILNWKKNSLVSIKIMINTNKFKEKNLICNLWLYYIVIILLVWCLQPLVDMIKYATFSPQNRPACTSVVLEHIRSTCAHLQHLCTSPVLVSNTVHGNSFAVFFIFSCSNVYTIFSYMWNETNVMLLTAVPVIRVGNIETASKTTTKVVLRLKLNYLLTHLGIKFEFQWIWNLHIFCNLFVIVLMIFGFSLLTGGSCPPLVPLVTTLPWSL